MSNNQTFTSNYGREGFIDDRFSASVLEELLSKPQEWVNINDIVKLCFKAILDLLTTYGSTLKEMEVSLASKIGLNDFNTFLSQKANVSEVSSTFEQIASYLENRPTIQDLEGILDDKVGKEDLGVLLENYQMNHSSLEMYLNNDSNLIKSIQHKHDDLLSKIIKIDLTFANISKSTNQNPEINKLKELIESKVSMDEFNEQMKDKASKTSVSSALHRKANKNDVELALSQKVENSTLSTLELSLSSKVDIDYFESSFNKVYEGRVERVELQSIRESINAKCDRSLIDSVQKDLNQLHGDVQSKIGNLATVTEEMEFKTDRRIKDLENAISDKVDFSVVKESIDKLTAREKLTSDTYGRIYERLEKLDTKVLNYASVDEVREALKDMKAEFIDKIVEVRDDVNKLDKFKAGVDATNEALALKADAALVEHTIGLKANNHQVSKLESRVEELYKLKLDSKRYEDVHHKLINAFEDLTKDIGLKASIKDVCKLLDLKANSNYVEKIVGKCQEEIQSKLELDTYKTDKHKEGQILDALIKENMVGRWIWKSGDLRSNSSIPWEIQSTNTSPDNFLWEKDKASVLVVKPGLYEITLGVYGKSAPTVQVLVNGEVVVKVGGNQKAGVISGSRLLQNITGLTYSDVFALPSKARIALCYAGEEGSEGFLGVKKL